MILECDEFEHNYKNGDYMCEEKRLSDIYDEPEICGKFMPVIRYNPDSYTVPENYKRLKKQERLDLMVKTMQYIVENQEKLLCKGLIQVFYIGYSPDNHKICKNYHVKMIYHESDLC
tara:strand:- start:1015 stop:1365 length:351 start_codon:yes stop_codon:yes gene_type:complete